MLLGGDLWVISHVSLLVFTGSLHLGGGEGDSALRGVINVVEACSSGGPVDLDLLVYAWLGTRGDGLIYVLYVRIESIVRA